MEILCSGVLSISWSNSQFKVPTSHDCAKMHSSVFTLGRAGYKHERESALAFYEPGQYERVN